MTRVASGGARAAEAGAIASPRAKKSPSGYFARTELPLTSLVFLLPLIVLYEIGTRAFVSDPVHQTEQRIIAFSLLQRFFEMCGASGRYLPGMAVVGILLAWHVARKDRWHVRVAHVGGMMVESVLLAIPLFVICRVVERYLAPIVLGAVPMAGAAHTRGLLVLSLGAGVYEELMFRLIAFALLSFLFFDVLESPKLIGSLLIVLLSAILFSGYHYLGNEPFRWWTFAFRLAAGIYFGVVFLCRGFGVTAGCHAAYDLCIVATRFVL